MPTPVSIHERIDRELIRRMAAALPEWVREEQDAGRMTAHDAAVAEVYRFDQDEDQEENYHLFSPVLLSDDNGASPGGQGGGGFTTWRRPMSWMVFWQKRQQVEPAATTHNRIAAWLESHTIDDDQLLEGTTNAPLLTDMEMGSIELIEPVDGQTNMVTGISFDLIYDTRRGNPYQGPATHERLEWQ